jgi:aminoglycoside phosphotransferase (APT) family kinase protein
MTRAEVEIDERLVRALLRAQHPDLADRPLRLGAEGWDNQLWRLGDDLAVRLRGRRRSQTRCC